MKNTFTKIIASLILTAAFALGVFAQKAEPKEIRFARGKSSATVTGRLKPDQVQEYVIRARSGQMLTLTFNSTVGNRAEVFVFSPSTSGETTTGNKTREVEFSSDGEIQIHITCAKSCSYSLKTAIK